MDSDEIRRELEAHPSPLHEIAEVRTFQARRETPDGDEEGVTFDFFDYGPGHLAGRYHCIATTESGRTASGNPADTLGEVLMTLHWK